MENKIAVVQEQLDDQGRASCNDRDRDRELDQDITIDVIKREAALLLREHKLALQQEQLQHKLTEVARQSAQQTPERSQSTLDAGGVELALRLQAPLMNLLTGKSSTQIIRRSEMPAKEEYDLILQRYDVNHELHGLSWIDFIESSPEDTRDHSCSQWHGT